MTTLELRNAHVLRWRGDNRVVDCEAYVEWLGDECVLHCDLRGNIQRVSRHAPAADQVGHRAPEVRSIDCAGGLLVPGLIDAHVHVTASSSDLRSAASLPHSLVAARAVRTLESMLRRGFTTVRDNGGADFGLARAVKEGTIKGPTIHFCGKALSATGGHGDLRLPGEHQLPSCSCCANPTIARVCDGEAAVRAAARDEIRKGATHLKLMAGGGVSSPTDRLTNLQFSDAELHAIVEEAAFAGIGVAAHAYTPASVKRAVQAGVASIEHGNYASDECLRLMFEKGTFLVPTLITYARILRDGEKDGMPRELVDKVGDLVEAGVDTLRRATDFGVLVAYGSDLLGASHVHQLGSIELHRRAQSATQVMASLTVIGAELLGLEGKAGVIEPGAHADMLLLDASVLGGHTGHWRSAEPCMDKILDAIAGNNIALVIKAGAVAYDFRDNKPAAVKAPAPAAVAALDANAEAEAPTKDAKEEEGGSDAELGTAAFAAPLRRRKRKAAAVATKSSTAAAAPTAVPAAAAAPAPATDGANGTATGSSAAPRNTHAI
eukprot:PRCOL_00002655-RA